MSVRLTTIIRDRLFGVGVALAVIWAGFWGLATWEVFASSSGAGAVIGGGATAVAALLPAAFLLARRRRTESPSPKAKHPLPKQVRSSHDRLVKAYDDACRMAEAGVIETSSLRGVGSRIDELGRLLSADVHNQTMGGQSSNRLREQVEELTDLLVGLVDAAVDRRTAALDNEKSSATALREALERMRAEEGGHREVLETDT
jgi:hypothetical protein